MAMSQIKAGAIISYISIGVNLLIGLLYTPWMIHSIGKENYGLYVLATSVISLFVFDFGLGSAVTRFISRYLAEKRIDKVNNFMGLVIKLYIGIDVFFFLVLLSVFFFIPTIYQELTPDEIEKFKVVYAIAASYSIISFPFIPADGIITAHEKFVQLKLSDLFNKIFIVITMALCLWAGYGLYALVLVNAVSGVLTILIKLAIIKRHTDVIPNVQYSNKEEFRHIAGYSGWVTVTALAQRLIFNIAPTILGMVSGSAEIALFGIAATFEAYVFTFANALNGLFLPSVTKITMDKDGDVLPLMVRVGRIQIFIIGLIVLGFIGVGRDFINLWIGSDFSGAYTCVVLLIIPSFFFLPQLIGSNAVLAQNKVKNQAIVFVIMGVFNIIAGYFLAMQWGALGFAISIFFAYTIRTIGMDVVFYKELHINIWKFFKNTFVSMSVAIILVSSIVLFLSNTWISVSWLMLFVKAGVISVIYIFIFFTIGLNKNEKQLVLRPLKK